MQEQLRLLLSLTPFKYIMIFIFINVYMLIKLMSQDKLNSSRWLYRTSCLISDLLQKLLSTRWSGFFGFITGLEPITYVKVHKNSWVLCMLFHVCSLTSSLSLLLYSLIICTQVTPSFPLTLFFFVDFIYNFLSD